MEIKGYLRVVASTGDDDDDYSMVEISNRRAREAADLIEKLEAALRKIKDLHDQPGPEDEQVIMVRDDMTYFIVCEALDAE